MFHWSLKSMNLIRWVSVQGINWSMGARTERIVVIRQVYLVWFVSEKFCDSFVLNYLKQLAVILFFAACINPPVTFPCIINRLIQRLLTTMSQLNSRICNKYEMNKISPTSYFLDTTMLWGCGFDLWYEHFRQFF